MATEELEVVRLRDDFYRDGFYKIITALTTIIIAIIFLILISIFLFVDKPLPVRFATDEEWRILLPVPVQEVYLTTPDLIQWVSEVFPRAFTFDFINHQQQLKDLERYFTPNGWKKYLEYVNRYAKYETLQKNKLFLSSYAAGAPFVLNQGLLENKYAWWVQMPINVVTIGLKGSNTVVLKIQALIVRVPTLNNISGIAVDNIIINE